MIRGFQEEARIVKLNYEIPYNDWLHQFLEDKLMPLGFVVYQRNKECPKAPAPISEYVYCRSDILLYHDQNVEVNATALQVNTC